MITRLLIIGISFFHLIEASPQPNKCPPNIENKVPDNIVLEPTSQFQYLDSGLTICPAYSVPCDGILTQWQFIAINPYVIGLHLAVFRRRKFEDYNVFDIIGDSYLNALHTPANLRQAWVYHPIDPPIPVNKSDVIGFFYDNFKTRNELLSIGSLRLPANQFKQTGYEPCIVALKDSNTIGTSGMVNMVHAATDYRIPGLVAVISPDENNQNENNRDDEDESNFSIIKPSFSSKGTAPAFDSNEKVINELDSEIPSTADDSDEFIPGSGDGETVTESESIPLNRSTLMPFTPLSYLCLKTPTALQVCTEATMRAFFDYRQGHCQAFYGCPPAEEGTENNFMSLDHCQKACYS